MIEFALDAEVLGNTVFAFSPLAEVSSSLRLLNSPSPSQLHRPWLLEARRNLAGMNTSHVELLQQVMSDSKWAPSFLFPPVASPRTTIEEQLHTLSMLPADTLVEDLKNVWPGASWPARLGAVLERGSAAGEALARATYDYWTVVLAPYWERMTGVLEDDVSFRASQSLQGGLFMLLADLHPHITLAGDRLLIEMPAHTDASYGQARLTLVPSIFVWPGMVLTHETPGSFEVTYGARGTGGVWEGLAHSPPEGDALAALLGRSRASILVLLAVPRSTTHIARELGQSSGSVSQHLSVLRESGLARSWRSGRSVLYQQTPLAVSLVEMNQPGLHDGRRAR